MAAPAPEIAAAQIFAAAQAGQPWPAALRGLYTIPQGYALQQVLLAHRVKLGDRHVGWKIGQTSKALRAARGTTEPTGGHIVASGAVPDGGSASIGVRPKPCMEPELCLTLGRDLRGPGVTPGAVADAAAAICPAIELVSLRGDMLSDFALGVADNLSHWGYVLGPDVRPYPRSLPLPEVVADVWVDGAQAFRILGSEEVIDNQFASVAWLANLLGGLNVTLRAGQRILTGSFVKPVPVQAGQRWEARFSHGLGSVSVTIAS